MVRDKIVEIGNWFIANGPLIQTAMTMIGKAITDAWNMVIKPALDGLFKIVGDIGTLILQVLTGDWDSAWKTAQKIIDETWATIKGIFEGIIKFINENFYEAVKSIEKVWEDVTGAIRDAIKALEDFFRVDTSGGHGIDTTKYSGMSYGGYGGPGKAAGGAVSAGHPYYRG